MAGRPIAELFATVRPDMSGFSRDIDKEARKLKLKPIKINVEIDKNGLRNIQSQIAKLASKVALSVALDRASARAAGAEAIRIIESVGPARIRVSADGASQAGRNAVNDIERAGPAKIRIDVDKSSLNGLSNILGSASGGIGGAGASFASFGLSVSGALTAAKLAALGLSPALAAVASSAGFASASLVALAPAAIGAGTAFVALKSAFSGVTEALKLSGQVENEVARTSAKNSAQRLSNSIALRNAQQAVVDAMRQEVRVVDLITPAVASLNRAQEDAVDTQRDLNRARADAIADLQEMRDSLNDLALDEEGASLAVERAYERLNKVNTDAKASSLDRKEAAFDVKKAEDRLKDAQEDRLKKTKELNDAEKKGVAGNEKVIEAENKRKKALEAVKKEELELVKARKDQAQQNAKAKADKAQNVAEAKQRLSDLKKLQAAQEADAASANTASAAQTKLAKALAKLSPAGRAFYNTMKRMQGRLEIFGRTMETAVLPGFTKFLNDIMEKPKGGKSLFDVFEESAALLGKSISNTVGKLGDFVKSDFFKKSFAKINGENAKAFDAIGRAIVVVAPALTRLFTAAAPLVTRFALYIERVASSFAEWIEGFSDSDLEGFFKRAGDELSKWWTIAINLGRIIGGLFGASFPTGSDLVTRLGEFTDRIADFVNSEDGQKKIQEFFEFFEKIPYGDIATGIGDVAEIVGGIIKFGIDNPEAVAALAGLFLAMKGVTAVGNIKESLGKIFPFLNAGDGKSMLVSLGKLSGQSKDTAIWVQMANSDDDDWEKKPKNVKIRGPLSALGLVQNVVSVSLVGGTIAALASSIYNLIKPKEAPATGDSNPWEYYYKNPQGTKSPAANRLDYPFASGSVPSGYGGLRVPIGKMDPTTGRVNRGTVDPNAGITNSKAKSGIARFFKEKLPWTNESKEKMRKEQEEWSKKSWQEQLGSAILEGLSLSPGGKVGGATLKKVFTSKEIQKFADDGIEAFEKLLGKGQEVPKVMNFAEGSVGKFATTTKTSALVGVTAFQNFNTKASTSLAQAGTSTKNFGTASQAALTITKGAMDTAANAAKLLKGDIDRVPKTSATTVTTPGLTTAQSQLNTLGTKINEVKGTKTVAITSTGYDKVIKELLTLETGQSSLESSGTTIGAAASAVAKAFAGINFKAAGGHIRGPGTGTSDSIPAMLSNGEYVIRANAVKALGVDALDDLNHADKKKYPHFASGGAVSWPFPTNMSGFKMPAARAGATDGGAAMSGPVGTLGTIPAWVTGARDASRFGSNSGVGNWIYQQVKGAGLASSNQGTFDVRNTATGNKSMHGYGRAVDLPAKMSIFNWLRSNFGSRLKELIYSPAGGSQIYNGRNHYYTGITRADHFDHVHASYAKGGLVNANLYDQGGYLRHGEVGVNLSGQRERVLNPAETRDYEKGSGLTYYAGDVNFYGDFNSDVSVSGAFQMARMMTRGAGG